MNQAGHLQVLPGVLLRTQNLERIDMSPVPVGLIDGYQDISVEKVLLPVGLL